LDKASRAFWHPVFFDIGELERLPERSVAVALSQQDFDGIAISEFLALGLPVVATPASGHLALASESRAVVIVNHIEDAFKGAVDLLGDDDTRRALGRRGRQDMLAQRGYSEVGARLTRLLRDVCA
jgi:glycosyltransferase involved in cell wall biosynthesis